MKTIYSKEIRDKYQDQKWMAKCRGIEFRLTIDQWVDWWKSNLGEYWLQKRGCKSGQYVMARKLDKGAYALSNIECITSNKNHSDMKKHHTYAITSARLSVRDLREIFFSKPEDEIKIAKKHKIRTTYVALIKRRKVWASVTKNWGNPAIKGYVKGDTHPLATLSVDEVKQIFLAKGLTNQEIADKFSIRKGLVSSIRTGGSWLSVTKNLGPIPNRKRGSYKKK